MAEQAAVSRRVKVGNVMGIHARPAAQLAHLAGRFQSDVKLRRLDRRVEADCRSVLAMLMLSATKDTELELYASGVDAAEAVESLSGYFARNFDED